MVRMFAHSGTGHFGGSLSCAEIVACLYFDVLQIDPKNPKWDGRDRFIISKGHSCPTVYAALARLGFFPDSWLDEFEDTGAPLTMHPDMHKIPGIEASTGALGHGLSIGLGMAQAAKMDGKEHRVYVLLGDAELQEGSVWEAITAVLSHQPHAHDRKSGHGPTEELIPRPLGCWRTLAGAGSTPTAPGDLEVLPQKLKESYFPHKGQGRLYGELPVCPADTERSTQEIEASRSSPVEGCELRML